MENQHRKIKGYRELSQEEIDAMNLIKSVGITLDNLVKDIEAKAHLVSSDTETARWIAIGKTDLQRGLMALTRAVAKPEFF